MDQMVRPLQPRAWSDPHPPFGFRSLVPLCDRFGAMRARRAPFRHRAGTPWRPAVLVIGDWRSVFRLTGPRPVSC